jgi:hypothetical protein
MSQPLNPKKRIEDRMLGVLQSWSECCGGEKYLILSRDQNMIPWSSSLKLSYKILLLKCNITASLMKFRLEGKKCTEVVSLISTVLITLSGECVNDSSYLRVMQ